ncbi:hypothetical protein CEXT_93711 [Caerostris extrusa]|uniref:Transposase n=1 Tax=Caerostris extrusa TaxID=172846 RepID=A0AAV4YBK2_CAEEX|nr:hypothetical protein CEXT_93711 [Caerostris extrusa]
MRPTEENRIGPRPAEKFHLLSEHQRNFLEAHAHRRAIRFVKSQAKVFKNVEQIFARDVKISQSRRGVINCGTLIAAVEWRRLIKRRRRGFISSFNKLFDECDPR